MQENFTIRVRLCAKKPYYKNQGQVSHKKSVYKRRGNSILLLLFWTLRSFCYTAVVEFYMCDKMFSSHFTAHVKVHHHSATEATQRPKDNKNKLKK